MTSGWLTILRQPAYSFIAIPNPSGRLHQTRPEEPSYFTREMTMVGYVSQARNDLCAACSTRSCPRTCGSREHDALRIRTRPVRILLDFPAVLL